MGPKSAVFYGHSDCVYALETGPKPGDFYSSGADGQVVAWNIHNPDQGKLIAKTSGTVYSLSYLKDTKKLLIPVNKDGIHLIDLETGKVEWMHSTPGSNWFRIKKIDTRVFFSGSRGDLLSLDLKSYKTEKHQIGTTDLRGLAVQKKSGRIAVGNSNGDIHILSPDFESRFSIQSAHKKTVFGLIFYPFSNHLLSVGLDARINLWELSPENQFQKTNSIPAHLFGIHDVAIHPTKPLIATASMDKTIKIWDAETLKLLRVLDKSRHAGHGHSINQLLWLEEQELLLSCSDDRTISAWNIFE